MKKILLLITLGSTLGCSTMNKSNNSIDSIANAKVSQSKARKPAGSSAVDCINQDKTISFSVGNGDHVLRLKYKDVTKKGANVSLEFPIALAPDFTYNARMNDSEIKIAIPVGSKVLKTGNDEVSEGPGRQYWDYTYQQTIVITGKNNESALDPYNKYFIKNIKQIDSESGYISDVFNCHSHGSTTTGGYDSEK